MSRDSARPLYVAVLAAVLALVGIVAANSAQAECDPRFSRQVGTDCVATRTITPDMLGDRGNGTTPLPILPDPAMTPGAIATSDKTEICARVNGLTYTKRHRVWTGQRQTLAKYGVPWADHRSYEDDDRVPVCAGGDNANPLNHWPQPSRSLTPWGYEVKDWLDAEACRMICSGKATVEEAQGWFLEPDWRRPYCEQRPSDPLCGSR